MALGGGHGFVEVASELPGRVNVGYLAADMRTDRYDKEDLAPRLEMKLYYFKSSNSPTGSASEKISMLSKSFNLQTQDDYSHKPSQTR